MKKGIKINLIMLFTFALIASLLCLAPLTSGIVAKAEVIYTDEVVIENYGDGYRYGNNGSYVEAESIQAIFDDVVGKNLPINAIIRFNNVTTNEELFLSYARKIVLKGSVTYTGTINDVFITLLTGEIEFLGIDLASSLSCLLAVKEGASATLSSGTLEVDGAVSGLMQSTIYNRGRLYVNSGVVRYNSTVVGNAGQAILVSGPSAILEVAEITPGTVIISGKTALRVENGTATISGGSFNATASDSAENGSALKVYNDAKVTLNGGMFNSVRKETTVVLAGNGNSYVDFKGGTVNGGFMFQEGASASISSLYVLGRTIKANSFGNVLVNSESGETTVESARVDYKGINGYYLSAWQGGEGKTPLISSFPSNATIIPNVSNLYEITLKIGEEEVVFSKAYGTSLNPENLVLNVPAGYEVKGWKNSLGQNVRPPFQVEGKATYEAELKIGAPVFNISNVNKVYDGDGVSYLNAVNEVDGFTYQYVWQRKNVVSDMVDYLSAKEITFKKVEDSGVYRLKVVVSDGVNEESYYSEEISVNIAKGTYQKVTHGTLSGKYDPNLTLADYLLDEGFSWVEKSTVPTVSVKEYQAIYCLDEENYNPLSLTITIELQKGDAVVSEHNVMAGRYKYSPTKTLLEYPFENNEWRWGDDSIVPTVGTNYYVAYYNPDRENYLDYETEVALVIEKGSFVDIPDLEFSIEYENGLNVRTIKEEYKDVLGYYSFATSVLNTTELNEIKTFKFSARYNSDKANYNDYTTCLIKITVIKGNNAVDYNVGNVIEGVVYSPLQTLRDIELSSSYWRFEEPSIVPTVSVKEYYLLYNPDPSLFNDFRLKVTIEVQKATLSGITHGAFSAIYSPTQTLSSFTLESGWTWVNVNEVPVVNKNRYQAVYDKGENYNLYYYDIAVTISKATLDMSDVSYESKSVTYNGQAHTIEYVGTLPEGVIFVGYEHTSPHVNAGRYECKAYFSQIDKENYFLIDEVMEAVLVINKADYDLSGITFANKSVVYDGTAHSILLEGSLPNGIVVTYYNNGKVNAGKYVIELQFTQNDTLNYNQLPIRTALLTIEKAQSQIIAEEQYVYAYNGNEQLPIVAVNNGEQSVVYQCETSSQISAVGSYQIKYFALESANYLYAEKDVLVVINKTEIACGTVYGKEISALIGKIVNVETGISEGSVLTMDVTSISNEELTFNILLNGESKEGNYLVSILIPDGMYSPQVYCKVNGEYVLLESKIGGNYLIFNTTSLGEYKITANGEEWTLVNTNALEWWGWLLISIAIAIVISGVVVLILLYKKGKLPLEKVKELLKVVQNKKIEGGTASEDAEEDTNS